MYSDIEKKLDPVLHKLREMIKGEFSHKLDYPDPTSKDSITFLKMMINTLSENWNRVFPNLNTMPYDPVADFVSALVFSIDEKGRIIQVNETSCSSLGRSESELVGNPFSVFLSIGSQKKWSKVLKRFKGGKKAKKVHLYLDFLMASELTISRCCNLYFPRDSGIIQVIGVCHSLYSSLDKLSYKKGKGNERLNHDLDLKVSQLYTLIRNDPTQELPYQTVLAKQIGTNVHKLKTGFKQKYGIPINQFMIKERLKWARTELLKSEKPIKFVAADAGFKNLSHFFSSFKAEFHITPRQMRMMGRP